MLCPYLCGMLKKNLQILCWLLLLAACGPSPEESLNQNRQMVQNGQYAEAIKQLDELLEKQPDMAAAYNLRGVAYLESGQLQDAVSDFSQAIRYQAEDYKFWFNRANARLQVGELAPAVQDYNEAIRLEPNIPDTYINRAAALFEMKNTDAALQDIGVALEKAPENALVQFNAGKLYYALDSLQKSRIHLTEAIRLDKQRAEAFYLLGKVLQQQGEQQEACTLLKQAAQLGSAAAKEASQACS